MPRGRPRKNPVMNAETSALYPVKLLKNYRPSGEWQIQKYADPEDTEAGLVWVDPDGDDPVYDAKGREIEAPTGEKAGAKAGWTIRLDKDRAKRIVAMKIAEVSTSVFD